MGVNFIKKRTIIAIIITIFILFLTNKYWLVLKPLPVNFDFMVFSIILVLTFLLAHKLANYVAEFNTIKGKSGVEIVFLSCFFIFLLIPMLHINQDNISKKENRTLAQWKPLISSDNKINFEFGNNFNEWFNDRFNLRNIFNDIYSSLHQMLVIKYPNGFIDKQTQTVYTSASFGYTNFSTEEVKTNFQALYQLNDYCKKHNIKLYILLAPLKANIHKSKYSYINDNAKHQAFLDYMTDIHKDNKIKVIYPYKEMINAINEGKQLYFKTEHHWTDDGAFIGYQELMKEIQKDYPDIKTLKPDDFNYIYNKKIRGNFHRKFTDGDECGFIGITSDLCNKYQQFDYKYYKYKDFDNLKTIVIDKPYHRGKLYYYDKGANHRVVLLGDSMNENLTEFIPFTFKNVKRIRNNNVKNIEEKDNYKIIKYYETEILDYKPDIIIFCTSYANVGQLYNLFNME